VQHLVRNIMTSDQVTRLAVMVACDIDPIGKAKCARCGRHRRDHRDGGIFEMRNDGNALLCVAFVPNAHPHGTAVAGTVQGDVGVLP